MAAYNIKGKQPSNNATPQKENTKTTKPLLIEVHKPVLLSGTPVLKYIPALGLLYGNDIHAIVYHQIHYLAREDLTWQEPHGNLAKEFLTPDEVLAIHLFGIPSVQLLGEDSFNFGYDRAKRISYNRLHSHIPFISKRWMMKAILDLEAKGLIYVERSKRVNVYKPIYHPELLAKVIMKFRDVPEAYGYKHTVLPPLVKLIGLKEAIVLQQIHLRHYQFDGSMFVIRSFIEWHTTLFPYWSMPTIKRIFAKLKKLNLVTIGQYQREDALVHKYRVNYVGLAQLLGIPVPLVANPCSPNNPDSWDNDWENWTNPVTLKRQGKG